MDWIVRLAIVGSHVSRCAPMHRYTAPRHPSPHHQIHAAMLQGYPDRQWHWRAC